MITFVCSYPYHETVDSLRGDVLAPLVPPTRSISYDSLFAVNALRPCTYIFTDLERLAPSELRLASRYFRKLAATPGFRVLNDPARVRTRYGLLRTLAEARLNDFDAYCADGLPKPRRFPVFIRTASDHAGPIGDLLHTQQELDDRLAALEAEGVPLVGLLVIEFCGERKSHGYFEKMSFTKVGDQISVAAVLVNDHWMVKDANVSLRLMTPEMERDQLEAVVENRFAETVRPAFAEARIDYGRADVGFSGGRMQVYEINTNPNITAGSQYPSEGYAKARKVVQERLGAMLHQVDSPLGADAVPISLGRLERPLRIRRNVAIALRQMRRQEQLKAQAGGAGA